MQRKPGGYRKPTDAQRDASRFSKEDFDICFQQFWTLTGASTRNHPAPYPLELAHRIVRMFSFVGDVVLDPFLGTGTTVLAAMKTGRNSIGVEIEPAYFAMAKRAAEEEASHLFSPLELRFEDAARMNAKAAS